MQLVERWYEDIYYQTHGRNTNSYFLNTLLCIALVIKYIVELDNCIFVLRTSKMFYIIWHRRHKCQYTKIILKLREIWKEELLLIHLASKVTEESYNRYFSVAYKNGDSFSYWNCHGVYFRRRRLGRHYIYMLHPFTDKFNFSKMTTQRTYKNWSRSFQKISQNSISSVDILTRDFWDFELCYRKIIYCLIVKQQCIWCEWRNSSF